MRRKRQISSEPTVQLSHKIALIPKPKQAIYFGMACGTARFPWNWALAECNRQVDAGLKPNAASLKKAFTAVKYQEQTALAEPLGAYGGCVTPVRHDIRSQRGSGQEEKEALSVTSCDHICAPFR